MSASTDVQQMLERFSQRHATTAAGMLHYKIAQEIRESPMSSPLVSSRGPPELPGLMAASVWMTFLMGTPLKPGVASSRPSPDTIPCSAHTWRQLFGHRTAATWLCAACRESNHSAAESSFGWAGCFAFGKPRLQGFTQLRNKSGGVIHVCAVPR